MQCMSYKINLPIYTNNYNYDDVCKTLHRTSNW